MAEEIPCVNVLNGRGQRRKRIFHVVVAHTLGAAQTIGTDSTKHRIRTMPATAISEAFGKGAPNGAIGNREDENRRLLGIFFSDLANLADRNTA